jgi:general secretion pathway protein J
MRRRDERGFTLLELIIALAIVGALLVVAFGGMRVAIAAWTQGEDRAESNQHLRGVALVLARALGSTYPYRAPLGLAPDPVLLFKGGEDRIEFVTQAIPFPVGTPVAFAAVTIGIETDKGPALVIRQRVLPNRDPFTEATVALRDPAVQHLTFEYLNDQGEWQKTWETDSEDALPRGVRITISAVRGSGIETMPPLTVALYVGTR